MPRRKPAAKPEWPAMTVEMVAVSDLAFNIGNARQHSQEQVEQIAASISEFGFTMPVLTDEAGTLIAGHGRVQAAQLLGLAEVPRMVAKGWSQDQITAYGIADNKLTLNASWDESLLRDALQSIEGLDLTITGFSEDEISKLFDDSADVAIVDLPTDPVDDRFWISVQGPLARQADALSRLTEVLADFPEIKVDLGTVETTT
ncbi:MAG: ParB/Srx family N-terminal domain-containing protein [Pseudomonadota bacterium]